MSHAHNACMKGDAARHTVDLAKRSRARPASDVPPTCGASRLCGLCASTWARCRWEAVALRFLTPRELRIDGGQHALADTGVRVGAYALDDRLLVACLGELNQHLRDPILQSQVARIHLLDDA